MKSKNKHQTKKAWGLAVITVLLVGILSSLVPAQTLQPNCGITSTLALAEMRGKSIPAEATERLLKEYPQPTVSLSDIREMTASLGVSTQGIKASLDDLLKAQQPAIIHLTNPDHFVLLLDGSRNQLRLLETPGSPVTVVPRAIFEKRFDGYALIVPEDEKESPRVQFNEADYQFGIAGAGQKIEHDYKFANTGAKPLTVTIASSSCGCTVALFNSNQNSHASGDNQRELMLQPGAYSTVRVSFSVQSVGLVQQMVTLKTSDPARPIVYLTIRGTVPQDLQVAPQSILLDTSKGQSAQKVIQVVGPPTMDVTQVTADDPTLQVIINLDSSDATKRVWHINILRPALTAVGETKSTLTIKTTHPRRPIITIPISSIVHGDLQISPPTVFFGFVKMKEEKQVTLTIQSRTGQPFRITGAFIEVGVPDLISLEGMTNQSMVQHKLKLKLNTGQTHFIDGHLTLKTDIAGEEKITIRISALVENDVAKIEGHALPGANEAALLPLAETEPTNEIAIAIPQIEVGKPSPDFTASDTNGKTWKLSELKGKKNLLLTFFPKCFTGGCANHLSSLRDRQAEFDTADIQILAVSVDTADGEKGQKAFANQWQLKFPLIPDTKRTLSKLYGAAQNDKQLSARMSVLIDKRGIVRWIDTQVKVQTHGADVLTQMRALGIAR